MLYLIQLDISKLLIDHNQMDCATRKEAVAIKKATGSSGNIPRWNAVVKINREDTCTGLQKFTFELTYIAILPAKVGDQGNDLKSRCVHEAHVIRERLERDCAG